MYAVLDPSSFMRYDVVMPESFHPEDGGGSSKVTIVLSPSHISKLDSLARSMDRSKSWVVRHLIEVYGDKTERQAQRSVGHVHEWSQRSGASGIVVEACACGETRRKESR